MSRSSNKTLVLDRTTISCWYLYDQSHVSQATKDRMREYEYDSVFKRIASQTAFQKEFGLRAEVPLYSYLPTEERTKQTVPFLREGGYTQMYFQILQNCNRFFSSILLSLTNYIKGQLLDSGNRSGEIYTEWPLHLGAGCCVSCMAVPHFSGLHFIVLHIR